MQTLDQVRDQVSPGAPLPWDIRDTDGKLLLAKGQVISSAGQLEALIGRGARVDAHGGRGRSGAAVEQPRENLVELWGRLAARIHRVLRADPSIGGFEQRLDEVARLLIRLLQRDGDIAIYLILRQDPHRHALYGVLHAVHAALVAWLVAHAKGWSEADGLTVVKAALTMNVSILELQGQWSSQATPLTEGQRSQVREHPRQSVEWLRRAGVADAAWLQAVEQHHENPQGGGYPTGCMDISPMADLLRHADIFTARISPRAGRPPMVPKYAARELFMQTGGGPVASALIKVFGIYPPGSFVTLISGETAVVLRRGASATTPLVASLTNRAGVALGEPLRRDTAQAGHAVTGVVADQNVLVRLPFEKLYGPMEVSDALEKAG